MMSEAGQMYTIFLTLELFRMLPFFAVVDLKSIVCSSHDGQFSCIVEIQRRHVRLVVVRSESLYVHVSIERCLGQIGNSLDKV